MTMHNIECTFKMENCSKMNEDTSEIEENVLMCLRMVLTTLTNPKSKCGYIFKISVSLIKMLKRDVLDFLNLKVLLSDKNTCICHLTTDPPHIVLLARSFV